MPPQPRWFWDLHRNNDQKTGWKTHTEHSHSWIKPFCLKGITLRLLPREIPTPQRKKGRFLETQADKRSSAGCSAHRSFKAIRKLNTNHHLWGRGGSILHKNYRTRHVQNERKTYRRDIPLRQRIQTNSGRGGVSGKRPWVWFFVCSSALFFVKQPSEKSPRESMPRNELRSLNNH